MTKNKLVKWWKGVPKFYKTELLSAWHTFVPSFVAALLLEFQVRGDVTLGANTLLAIFMVAFRAGFKSLSIYFSTKIKS